ncbi:MAG: hypothetical protein SPH68_00485 [Candidatus Borkfalkiaceae bacterium]|nr:hypothetical protein [Clostridia bacterium]MDY6222625.1 hypothetical protein [Christensenellaceae bacterium]
MKGMKSKFLAKTKFMAKLLCVCLAALSAFSVAACAKDGADGDNGKTPANAPAKVSVTSPDGAPALALVQMIEEGDETVEFNIVNANTITTYVTNTDETKNSDFCVLPVNAAAKLLGGGEKYQMLGTVTHGNLFIVSKSAETQFTDKQGLETLIGKTVGVIQIANVPGMVFKMILNQYKIDFNVLSDGNGVATDKINLQGITDPTLVTSTNKNVDAFVIAEPLVSLRTNAAQNKLYLSGSLQQLYGGEEGYPQAVIVAKKSFTAKYPEWTENFIAKLGNAETYLKTAEASTIITALSSKLTEGETPAFNAKNLSAETVKNCNVKFVAAQAEKEAVRAVLTGMMGANAPQTSDEFFYTPGDVAAA